MSIPSHITFISEVVPRSENTSVTALCDEIFSVASAYYAPSGRKRRVFIAGNIVGFLDGFEPTTIVDIFIEDVRDQVVCGSTPKQPPKLLTLRPDNKEDGCDLHSNTIVLRKVRGGYTYVLHYLCPTLFFENTEASILSIIGKLTGVIYQGALYQNKQGVTFKIVIQPNDYIFMFLIDKEYFKPFNPDTLSLLCMRTLVDCKLLD